MLLTLLPYLTVAANLALVLGILLSLNQRLRQLCARTGRQETKYQTETARLAVEITGLKAQILELEQSGPALAPGAAASNGNSINNTLRSKVLKLHRLGQSPDRIAGTLRLPQGEVDLLVKVHKIVMRPYEGVVLTPLMGADGDGMRKP